MALLEILPLVIAGIAVLVALGSYWTSHKAQKISEIQALPRTPIGGLSTWGGNRCIDFEVEWLSGRPDWVVASASIRWNWGRRRLLALGQLEYSDKDPDGDIINLYQPSGPWKHHIIFDPPVRKGGIVLHPDAPDCQIRLKITLSTMPSPEITRYIISKRFGPQ